MLPRKDLYQLWLPCLFFIRSPSLKRITLLSQQKQQLQRKEASKPPPIKHPKPTAKLRESNKQQTPEDPSLLSKSPKTPVYSGNQSPTATSTVKPVQPVYPLPDRQQPSESSTSPSVRDKSLSMQQYKVHRSPGGSSGNRPHSLLMITSPTSSADHSNSDNNSGASTPLLYGERTSPSGSSCSTSVSGGHQQQRQHSKPPIALMQHSYAGDPGSRRVSDANKPFMTGFTGSEPLDVINLSQCSNSSRESSTSNRSKREIRSPEQQMKFSLPDNQYNVESHMRNADMPTVALRHSSGGQRAQQGRDEHELYIQPKRLGGYISDGTMSVTSSIEELTAINQTSDYTDQPLQSNVVIVKPQPVASTYYQHPAGVKDRHLPLSHDHKQHSGQGITSPNGKQAINSSHSYHTPQFASKGFPPGHHHGQFKNPYPPPHVTSSQMWATQRQGPPGNNYSKQGNKAGVAASPPSVKEGKPRGYLAADGSDYTNEMIVSYMLYGFMLYVCVPVLCPLMDESNEVMVIVLCH